MIKLRWVRGGTRVDGVGRCGLVLGHCVMSDVTVISGSDISDVTDAIAATAPSDFRADRLSSDPNT